MENDPYSVFAEFYDDIMSEIPYYKWVNYIEEIFEKHNIKVDSIVDLACGTGSVSTILARRGYEVIGIDISSPMLDKARGKTTSDLPLMFINADMRSYNLDKKYDVAICLFDSMNYILSESEMEKVFRSTYKVLKQEGHFIFDVNTVERFKNIKSGLSWYEGDNYKCLWKDHVFPEKCILKADLTFLIREDDGEFIQKKETHLERGYSPECLVSILTNAGFRNRAIYEAYTFHRADENDRDVSRLFFVTQKKSKIGQ